MIDQRQVLSDPALDEELARTGIVAVPLLDAAECRDLQDRYWEVVPPGEDGIRLDFLRDDTDLKRRLHEVLSPTLDPAIDRILPDHRAVYSSFVVKHPGPDSALFLHRDMAVDDERVRTTYAFWMPLVDVSPELDNGTVAFVPGSRLIRGGQCGPTTVMQFVPYVEHLQQHLQEMTVAAGTALVYDARMLHASEPNNTDVPRLAVGGLLARRDQPIIQVLATGRRHRLITEVDQDYFFAHTPIDIELEGMPSRYRVIDEYDEQPVVTTEEFLGPELASPDAVRHPLVPGDLGGLAGGRAPLPVEPHHWTPTHHHDLAIVAGDLPPVGELASATATVGGAVGGAALVRDGRSTDAPAALPDVGDLLGSAVADAEVVVIDQEARITLTAAEGDDADVVIVECPPVRSGAVAEGAVAELDLGLRIPLEPGRPVVVWNGGPGPVVAVVRRLGPTSSGGGPLT